jgi:alginate O-acetyltransferase complex protein AlgF
VVDTSLTSHNRAFNLGFNMNIGVTMKLNKPSKRIAMKAMAGLCGAQLLCISVAVQAQPAGLLYDPEPPADSAYVRVLVVSNDSAIDVVIDGKPRVTKLNAGDVSDYMVLSAGKHTIALHNTSKTTPALSHTVEVVAGKAMTVAFASAKPGIAPTIFEDKANTNKLKSLVSAYHLDGKAGPLNLMTADGGTKVFSNLSYGGSNSIQVNPISVELVAAKVSDAAAAANSPHTKLSMAAGANYSVFLMPNDKGGLTARAVQNKTERYTGK